MIGFLDDHDLLKQEPDQAALRQAYDLLLKDAPRGLVELERLANRGSAMAMLYLANEYKLKGEESYPTAQKWYRLAYENRSATALLNLALTYCDQRNYEEAEKIWIDGVSQNDAPSMFWLANLYLNAAEFESKHAQAMSLLESAAALGQFRAKRSLASLLMKERHNLRDFLRGVFLYFDVIFCGFKTAYRDPTSRRLW